MSVEFLSARLGRLAAEIDGAVEQLRAEPLSEDDLILLEIPLAHATQAVANLGQIVYEVEKFGKLDRRPVPITDAELREAA